MSGRWAGCQLGELSRTPGPARDPPGVPPRPEPPPTSGSPSPVQLAELARVSDAFSRSSQAGESGGDGRDAGVVAEAAAQQQLGEPHSYVVLTRVMPS